MKQHDVEQTQCIKIDSVNYVCKMLNDDLMNENSIDNYTSSSIYDDDFEKEKIMVESILSLNERNTEYLNSEEIVPMEEKSSEGLVLKELPEHLKYVFLEEEKFKPFITVANLIAENEQKVVETTRKHHEAIVWSVEDPKGINPSIFMHKILMEGNAKTLVEHQRRMNLVMKEVVKKKVLKWPNAGFIYAISDNQ